MTINYTEEKALINSIMYSIPILVLIILCSPNKNYLVGHGHIQNKMTHVDVDVDDQDNESQYALIVR